MVLYFLRGAFILLAASVTVLYGLAFQEAQQLGVPQFFLLLCFGVGGASAIIAIDIFIRDKHLSAISGVFLGLVAGLLAAYALSFVVELVKVLAFPDKPYGNLFDGIKVLIGLITCYVGMSLVIQTKDDFRFVIPYVEFSKQLRGTRPTLLDTSVIIDGRIQDILSTRILQGHLIVPRFVLHELQTIADSADRLKRARGRRGLDVLQKLREDPMTDISIEDEDAEGVNVDQKLVSLAQNLQARVMTNDFNLNKIANLRGVEVVNINDLSKALRPVVLPGERLPVKIVRAGEERDQGVAYLDDGTMVVVEDGRNHIGQDVTITVTSMLQTSAGRMIFGRHDSSGHGTTQAEGSQNERGQTDPSNDAQRQTGAEQDAPGQQAGGAHPRRRNPRRMR